MVVVAEITNTAVEASTMAAAVVVAADTSNSHAVASEVTAVVEEVEWAATAALTVVFTVVLTAVIKASQAILLISTMRTSKIRTMLATGSAPFLVLRQHQLAVLPLDTW